MFICWNNRHQYPLYERNLFYFVVLNQYAMLQQLFADSNFLFFTFHAFLIGATIGYLIARQTINKVKGKLKSQSRAYEELMNSLDVPSKKAQSGNMHVIRMNTNERKVSGLAY